MGSIPIQCGIEKFNLSGHSTREQILSYILKLHPRKVLLVHGEAGAVAWFREQIAKAAPEIEIIVPPAGQTLEI